MIAGEKQRPDTSIEAEFDESLEQSLGFVSPVEVELFKGVAVEDRGLGRAEQGDDLRGIANERSGVPEVEIGHNDDGRFEWVEPTGGIGFMLSPDSVVVE